VKPAQRIFDQRRQLPGAEGKLAQFALMRGRLLGAGYVDIGLDHFARPGDELAKARAEGTLHRNFQGYSSRAGRSLYGLGLSSISQTADTYRQNTKSLFEYRAALAAGRLPLERGYRLTAEDKRRRVLVMGLMCEPRLDFEALRERHGIDVRRDYAAELASLDALVADGLVRVDADEVAVLPAGEPLLRVVAMCFDATLQGGARRHAFAV
jgi:oxygen-independent coproporphyrinogen-3 oxidase